MIVKTTTIPTVQEDKKVTRIEDCTWFEKEFFLIQPNTTNVSLNKNISMAHYILKQLLKSAILLDNCW